MAENQTGSGTTTERGGLGGGIFHDEDSGLLTISDSTISGNRTGDGSPQGYGGGLYVVSSSAISRSTISGNAVGITAVGAGDGGGISYSTGIADGSTHDLLDTTISGNSATNGGGGIAPAAAR